MECLDQPKTGGFMWSKFWPHLMTILISFGLAYLFLPSMHSGSQKEKISNGLQESNETKETAAVPPNEPLQREIIIEEKCKPEEKIIYRDKIQIKEVPKVIYKERVVYRYKPLPEGCRADWETGEIVAKVGGNSNIRCIIDFEKRHIDQHIYEGPWKQTNGGLRYR